MSNSSDPPPLWSQADAESAWGMLLTAKGRRRRYRLIKTCVGLVAAAALVVAFTTLQGSWRSPVTLIKRIGLNPMSPSGDATAELRLSTALAHNQELANKLAAADTAAAASYREVNEARKGVAAARLQMRDATSALQRELAAAQERENSLRLQLSEAETRTRTDITSARVKLSGKADELGRVTSQLTQETGARMNTETAARLPQKEAARITTASRNERGVGQEQMNPGQEAGAGSGHADDRNAAASVPAASGGASPKAPLKSMQAEPDKAEILQEQLTALKAEQEIARARLAQLQTDLKEADARLSGRESAAARLQDALSAAESAHQEADEKLQAAKAELAEGASAARHREAALLETSAALEAAFRQSQAAREQVATMTARIATTESERDRAEAALELRRKSDADVLVMVGTVPVSGFRNPDVPIITWLAASRPGGAPATFDAIKWGADDPTSEELTLSKPLAGTALGQTPPALTKVLSRAAILLQQGDVAGGRLLLEHAMNAGSAEAAFRLAETYDPALRDPLGNLGAAADPELAQALYKRAREGGFAPKR